MWGFMYTAVITTSLLVYWTIGGRWCYACKSSSWRKRTSGWGSVGDQDLCAWRFVLL